MTVVAPARGAAEVVEVVDVTIPATPARVAAVLAVLVALVGALLGPTGRLDALLGAGGTAVDAGVVERQADDGWIVVPPGTTIGDGTLLRAPAGIATLRVAGGTVDLAEGTHVEVGPDLRVATGSVVVDSPSATVGDGGVVARGPGTWRFDATGRVGAYAGSVVATDATGRDTLVRALQQARARDGVVVDAPRPYVYADGDAFDLRHLATALGVDDYVAALGRGLSSTYGTAAQAAAFYTDFEGLDGGLVAALGDVGFDRDGSRIGPPADVLVAAVVTDALVVGAGLDPQPAADEVRTLRVAGATWGLIAQGRDLDAGDVRAAAERALARRQQAEEQGTAVPAVAATQAPGPQPPGPPAADAAPADVPAVTTPGDAPPAPGDVDPPAGPDTGAPGAPADEPGPVESVVDATGVDDVVDEVVGDEVGGLVDDLVRGVDDLVEAAPPVDAVADPLGSVLGP